MVKFINYPQSIQGGFEICECDGSRTPRVFLQQTFYMGFWYFGFLLMGEMNDFSIRALFETHLEIVSKFL